MLDDENQHLKQGAASNVGEIEKQLKDQVAKVRTVLTAKIDT